MIGASDEQHTGPLPTLAELDATAALRLKTDADDEIYLLIESLHRTERRLEQLTGGEVDTVADQLGRPLMLRRAQDDLRRADAARQVAILDALPAHVALLDTRGIIVSVNESWRRFEQTDTHERGGENHAQLVGTDYLALCDGADDAPSERHPLADGIRSVLSGASKSFSCEYPHRSLTQLCWFMAIVSPLPGIPPKGAVVMHMDITAERAAEDGLRDSELRLRQLAENIQDVFFLIDTQSERVLYISPAYERVWGNTCESLYANGKSWMESIHPDDRPAVEISHRQAMLGAETDYEFRIVPADGAVRWIRTRNFPVADGSGKTTRITSIAKDITERKRAEAALKLSDFSINHASSPMYWIGQDARIRRVNRAACDMLGYSESELLAMAITDLNPEFPPARWVEHWQNLRKLKRMMFETTHRRKDGSVFPVEVDLNWFEFEGREYDFASARDISERRRATERINQLNRVYAVLSGINTLIVRVSTREELFREACDIAVKVGGFRAALMGMADHDRGTIVPVALASEDRNLLQTIDSILSSSGGMRSAMVAEAMREKKAVVANHSQNDTRVLFADKHVEFDVRSMVIVPLIVADEAIGALALYAGENDFFHEEEMKLLNELANDIAFAIDHIGKSERLNYLAYYDVLTGLANRTLFLDRLAQFMRSAGAEHETVAVALIDLERFKNINDTLGRPAGDALLKQVAEWLVRAAGDASLVARIDADHFALVLPTLLHEDDVMPVLEKKRQAFVNHAFHIAGSPLRITFKSGVAMYPEDGSDAEALFLKAEVALKKAKATGEPYLSYTKKMSTAMVGKVSLESQLREALDNNEFVLYYQPKINLASGKLTGAEALIRWNDPRAGLVLPLKFISILEETGMIHDVGRWALSQAITDHLHWLHSGMAAVRVSVNVSPLQLRHRDFLAEIEHQIEVDVHAPSGLELEITESVIMEDVQRSIEILNAARNLGVAIAIDDFGTGFSSLSYLARLPVDTLKIDRSFIEDMTVSPAGLALVSTIINLAHSLKLNVVAEGVESEEQSRLLRLLGCDELQGYIFSVPLPVKEFEERYLTISGTMRGSALAATPPI